MGPFVILRGQSHIIHQGMSTSVGSTIALDIIKCTTLKVAHGHAKKAATRHTSGTEDQTTSPCHGNVY
eukprot:2686616-Amphidinium_carterae.1